MSQKNGFQSLFGHQIRRFISHDLAEQALIFDFWLTKDDKN